MAKVQPIIPEMFFSTCRTDFKAFIDPNLKMIITPTFGWTSCAIEFPIGHNSMYFIVN